MHLPWRDSDRPFRAIFVPPDFHDGAHQAPYANAVAAHERHLGLALFIIVGHAHGLGIFTAQLENVPDLDTALELEPALSVGGQVARLDIDHIDGLDSR